MHASLAYVNGAGSADEDIRLLNILLSTGSERRRRSEEHTSELQSQ